MRFFSRSGRAFLQRALAPYCRSAVATADVDAPPTASALAIGSAGLNVEPVRPQTAGLDRTLLAGGTFGRPADSLADAVARLVKDLQGS